MSLSLISEDGFLGSVGEIAPIQNEQGDIWQLDIRYDMPGGVIATNRFIYKQLFQIDDEEGPAFALANMFLFSTTNPWFHIRRVQGTSVSTICAIVSNLSDQAGFVNVFTATDLDGLDLSSVSSTQIAHRIVLQDATGSIKARKSIYFGGIAKGRIVKSKLNANAYDAFDLFILNAYHLKQPVVDGGADVDHFSWMYGLVAGEYQEVQGAYTTCYPTRLKGRAATAC